MTPVLDDAAVTAALTPAAAVAALRAALLAAARDALCRRPDRQEACGLVRIAGFG